MERGFTMPRIYSRRMHLAHQEPKEEPPKSLYELSDEERQQRIRMPVLQFLNRPDPPVKPRKLEPA